MFLTEATTPAYPLARDIRNKTVYDAVAFAKSQDFFVSHYVYITYEGFGAKSLLGDIFGSRQGSIRRLGHSFCRLLLGPSSKSTVYCEP